MIGTTEIAALGTGLHARVSTAYMAHPAPGPSQTRVLVVEDDVDMRLALRETFEMRGMSVDCAMDGVAASVHALKVPYDVVVSDIRLPGMSGIALTRSLQMRARPPRVILITAYPEWKVVQDAYEAGACEVVRKPLDLGRLAERVAQVAVERLGGL